MKRFRLTRAAERDLDLVKAYLLEKTCPTVTRRIIKDLRFSLILLGSEPGLGHAREDLTDQALKF